MTWSGERLIDVSVPPSKPSKSDSSGKQTGTGGLSPDEKRIAEIWTSEGVTSSVAVQVQPFRPSFQRNGVLEQPCWSKTEGQADSDSRGNSSGNEESQNAQDPPKN